MTLGPTPRLYVTADCGESLYPFRLFKAGYSRRAEGDDP